MSSEEQHKQEEHVSVESLEKLLSEIDDDEIPVIDEEAEFDYQRDARQRKAKEEKAKQVDDAVEVVLDDAVIDVEEKSELSPSNTIEQYDFPVVKDDFQYQANTIFVHEPLNKISMDFASPLVQSHVGKAVALRVCKEFIAVGTERGLILLYNRTEYKRVAIIGTVRATPQLDRDSVIAIDFGPTDSRILLAAYASGDLVVWSLESFLPIKRLTPFANNSFGLISAAFVITSSRSNFPTGAAYLSSALEIYIAAINSSGAIKMYTVKRSMFSVSIDEHYFPVESVFNLEGTPNVVAKELREQEENSIRPSGGSSAAAAASSLDEELFASVQNKFKEKKASVQLLEEDRVTGFSVLPLGEGHMASNLFGVAAVMTKKAVTIVELVRMHKRIAKIENENLTAMLPCVAWRRSEVPNDEYHDKSMMPKSKHPYLAVAWGNEVSLHRIVPDESSSSSLVDLAVMNSATFKLSCNVSGITYISEQVLAVVASSQSKGGSKKSVMIIDPFYPSEDASSGPEVETLDVPDSFEHVFCMDTYTHQAVHDVQKYSGIFKVTHEPSRLLLLGDHFVQSFSAKTWEQRVALWSKVGQIESALGYAVELYNGFSKAAIGVPTNVDTRHRVVSAQISELLTVYYQNKLQFEAAANSELSHKRQAYEEIGITCIRYALQINNMDIFWILYEKYREDGFGSLFIGLLQPFIMGDEKLKAQIGSPYDVRATSLYFGLDEHGNDKQLLTELIRHYKDAGAFEELENCLIRLELRRERYVNEELSVYTERMQNLFNELCAICEERLERNANSMMKLYCYIYNSIKDDYITPIEYAFFKNLKTRQGVSKGADAVTRTLFEYLHKAYTGQSFGPLFSVPEKRIPEVKRQLINYIFKETASAAKAIPEYNVLDVLLRADHAAFFEFLEMVFNDHRTSSPWVNQQQLSSRRAAAAAALLDEASASSSLSSSSAIQVPISFTLTRQKVAEILLQVIVDLKSAAMDAVVDNLRWPLPLTAEFFSFLLQFIAKTEVDKSGNNTGDSGIIRISPFVQRKPPLVKDELDLVYRALNILCADTSASSAAKQKREANLVAVLSRYEKLPDSQKLINYCEDRKYFQVAIHLHKLRTGRYAEIISCYLRDDANKLNVFNYIKQVAVNEDEPALRLAVIDNVVKLLTIDAASFTDLIYTRFPESHSDVMKVLVNENSARSRNLLFQYLEQINVTNEKIEANESSESGVHDERKKIFLDEELQNNYVEMLCIYKPEKVFDFLKNHETTKMEKILQHCEEIARQYAEKSAQEKYDKKHTASSAQGAADNSDDDDDDENEDKENNEDKDNDKRKQKKGNEEDEDAQEHINIAEKIEEAISFLYERNGEVRKALDKVMKKLEAKKELTIKKFSRLAKKLDPGYAAFIDFREFVTTYNEQCATISIDKAQYLSPAISVYNTRKIEEKRAVLSRQVREMNETLDKAIELCIRTTKRKTSDDPTEIWFTLLDSYLLPMRKMRIVSMDSKNRDVNQDVKDRLSKLESDIAKQQSRANDSKNGLDAYVAEKKEEFNPSDKRYLSKKAVHDNDLAKLTRLKSDYDNLKQQLENKADPYSAQNLPPLANLWLQDLYLRSSQRVINQMINKIPVPIIIRKVMDSNKDDEFSYIRNVIFRLLSLYDFEHELMRNSGSILERDTYRLCKQYKKVLSRGIKPVSMACGMCEDSLEAKPNDNDCVRLFECGHAFHIVCISAVSNCPLCPEKKGARLRARQLKEANPDEDTAGGEGEKLQSKNISSASQRISAIDAVLNEDSKMSVHKNLIIEVAKAKQKNAVHGVHVTSKLQVSPCGRQKKRDARDRKSQEEEDRNRLRRSDYEEKMVNMFNNSAVYFDMQKLLHDHENMLF